jgi:hypothetical protein
MVDALSETERRFVARAIRRRGLFLALSALGVAVGLGLGAYFVATGGAEGAGLRFALVVLILLNARQNLRQARYAQALEKLQR